MLRGIIYDAVFRPLTTRWYREVLARLPSGARLLDVGIGTAGALSDNRGIVRDRRLHVTGIDIDADYLERARERLRISGLDDVVTVKLESVYDHQGGPYDAVYFSASFMLLPEPGRALRHVATLLQPEGHVFFTQTFNERRSPLLEKTKPLLGKITTMEFGRVTYEDDFLHALDDGGLQLQEFKVMNINPIHSYRLAVAARRELAP